MRHVFSEMYERRQTNRIINNLYHRVEERNEGLDRGKGVGSVPRLKAIKIFFLRKMNGTGHLEVTFGQNLKRVKNGCSQNYKL